MKISHFCTWHLIRMLWLDQVTPIYYLYVVIPLKQWNAFILDKNLSNLAGVALPPVLLSKRPVTTLLRVWLAACLAFPLIIRILGHPLHFCLRAPVCLVLTPNLKKRKVWFISLFLLFWIVLDTFFWKIYSMGFSCCLLPDMFCATSYLFFDERWMLY